MTSPTLPPLPEHPLVYANLTELIGDTPLVELIDVERPRGEDGAGERAQVFGKLESLNPGGSVKDRICLEMLLDAERRGLLAPGGTVVEPTSGNTGIGLAYVSARRGYRCILTMPASMSLERRQLLEALGATLVLTPEDQQMEGAVERARQLAAETPGSFMPQQFENPANPEVHRQTTAPELLEALGGRAPDAFVAGVGTGGTVSGVGQALRERGAATRIVAVEPESSATLSRGERGPTKIQGLAAGFVPRNFHAEYVDEIRTVTDERAYAVKQALARRMGLLVGISAGAAVAIAFDVARELGPGRTVVTILPDTGERYFSLDEHFRG